MSDNVYDKPQKSEAEVANEFQEARDRIDEERRQGWRDELEKLPERPQSFESMADEVYGVTPAEQLSRDWNIPRNIAAELTGLEARKGMPEPGGRTATEEEVEGWNKETDRLMRQEFGFESDAILEEMRTLVATRPDLAKALESSGSGSHSTIVLAIARAVKKRMDSRKKG